MPDGNVARIPDFALESTAQLILRQLTDLNKTNATKFKQLVDHAKEEAKKTEKFRKDDESDREDLYKATLDISKAVREGNKLSVDKNNTPSISIGPDISPTLSRLSGGAVQASANIDKMSAGVGETSENIGNLGTHADNASKQLDSFNRGAAIGEKAFVMFYDGAMVAAKSLSAAFILYGGILVDSFTGLGKELNELTKSGVAFTDGLSAGGMSATGAMIQLSGMGLNAVNVLGQFSSVVQSLGKGPFVALTQSFLDATDAGADLGMSLDESAERLGAELQKRQLMGALDGVNQARLQKQVTTSIRNQQKYATALGTSTAVLADFTDSLLSQTPALTANLFRLNADLRSQVIGGITDFGTAMRGLGGEEGGAIAAAMTEAAAAGAMGFSEGMTGYITALPSLAGPMNEYITAIQNGTLSQEQADEMAQEIATSLANVSDAEKNRIFALARAGDAQAESMAKAITQFEQSEKKLKDLNKGFTMDGVQRGTNTLTAIIKSITGSFDAIQTSFLAGLGNVGNTSKVLSESFEEAQGIIMDSIGNAMKGLKIFEGSESVFDGAVDGAAGLGEALGKKLPTIIKSAAETIGEFIEELPGIIESVKSFASGFMQVMKVVGVVLSGVGAVIGVLGTVIGGVIDVMLGISQGVMDTVLLPFRLVGSLLGYIADVIRSAFSPAIDAVATGFTALMDAIEPLTSAVSSLFSSVGSFIGGFTGEGDGLLKNMGYLTGVVGTVVFALSKLPVIGTFVTEGVKNFGSTLAKGASNVVGMLGKGLSKATGGLSDKLAGKVSERFSAKTKEMDMGSKALDSATKSSERFTKSLAKGMNDISKGVSNLMSNIGKGIGNFAKSIGTGIGGMFQAMSKGIASLAAGTAGIPVLLALTAAVVGIGFALRVAAPAIEAFGTVIKNVLEGAAPVIESFGVVFKNVLEGASLVALSIGSAIKGILEGIGTIAISVGNAMATAFGAIGDMMATTLDALGRLDGAQLLGAAAGITAVGVSLAALGAGKIVEGLGSFVSALFGAGGPDPIDQLIQLGTVAPNINTLSDTMANMGATVDAFNEGLAKLDGNSAKSQLLIMSEGFDALGESLNKLSAMDMLKMAAFKSFGPIQEQPVITTSPAEPVSDMSPETIAQRSPGRITSTTEETVSIAPGSRPRRPTEMSPAERAQIREQRRRDALARSSAQPAQIAAPVSPRGETVNTNLQTAPNAVQPTEETRAQSASRSDDLTASIQEMIKQQTRTNRLLERGNRTQSDIADNL